MSEYSGRRRHHRRRRRLVVHSRHAASANYIAAVYAADQRSRFRTAAAAVFFLTRLYLQST